MNRYRYEAADSLGKIESGYLEADSQSAAFASLRSRGLTALDVRLDGSQAAAGAGGLFSPRLSDNDLAWATRQLASLLGASLPLEAALSATVEQAERKHIAQTLSAVRADVRSGMRLAEALAARPRDFPEIYRALIAAGEESGDLAQVMERLADYIEERNGLRGKILTAFIYPGVVGLVSIGIVIFLLSYVVPQVVSAFSQARQDLPGLTLAMLNASDFIRAWGGLCLAALVAGFWGWRVYLRNPQARLSWHSRILRLPLVGRLTLAMLNASDFIRAWGGLCLAALVAGFWGWRVYLRNPQARLSWHSRILRLPLVGRFVLGLNTARFASTLAILGGAGVPLLRALEAARQTLSNDRLSQSVSDATAKVREGVNLAAALRVEKVFPPLLIHLIASGEKTGALPPMLERAAQSLSSDLERRAMGMTALLEPLMIVLMGGVVLVIVMAILLPIIEINQLVT
ncbi:type II secretion system protein GspF [Pseudomonas sp. ABAC61]|nr:type II secretion system protein GspF [Pseudomonas sp. ABAC61]